MSGIGDKGEGTGDEAEYHLGDNQGEIENNAHGEGSVKVFGRVAVAMAGGMAMVMAMRTLDGVFMMVSVSTFAIFVIMVMVMCVVFVIFVRMHRQAFTF